MKVIVLIIFSIIVSVSFVNGQNTVLTNGATINIGNNSNINVAGTDILSTGQYEGSGVLELSENLQNQSASYISSRYLVFNEFEVSSIVSGQSMSWDNVDLNNSKGLRIEGLLTIGNELLLNGGDIIVDLGGELIFGEFATYNDPQNDNRFSGRVSKIGVQEFVIPFISEGIRSKLKISQQEESNTNITSEFFSVNPTSNTLSNGLKTLSDNYFWENSRKNTVHPVSYEFAWESMLNVDFENLVVVHWNGTEWIELPTVSKTGDQNNGSIKVSTSLEGYFGFAQKTVAQAEDIIIGEVDGDNNNKVVNGYYNYSKFQYIYHPEEIGSSGDIIKIAFNVAGWTYSNSDGVLENFRIKVGHTTLDEYTSSSYSNDANITVWSGTYDPELGWNEFEFSQAFAYNGVDNFIVSIECEDGAWMGNPVPNFQYDGVSDYRSCRGYSDYSNPPSPYRERYLPVTKLTMGNMVPPLSIVGVTTNTSCSNTIGGSIDIEVEGGEAPYTYLWSSGQITKDVSGLSGGLYDLTVTDNGGRTKSASFQISNDVSWAYLEGIINPNDDHSILQKTIENSKYNNWARSSNRLDGDGQLSFTIPEIGGFWTIGLSTQKHIEGNYNAIDYGWEMWGTSIWIDESGDSPDFLYPKEGDQMKVVRKGNKILYYHNDTKLDHEAYIPSGTSLYVEAVIENLNDQITDISIDFCIPVELSSTRVNVSEESAGSIDLTVSGGLAPYSYQWSTGDQTEDISNLPAGKYTVTVTDSRGQIAQTTVKITTQIIWDYLVGIENVDNLSGSELLKTVSTSRTNNWARAKNVLIGDGELKVTFDGPGDYWVIGLSTEKHTEGVFYASDFAIESYGSSMWISENGSFPWFTSIKAGDEFRITREGSAIKYFYNDVELIEDESYVSEDAPLYLEAVINNYGEAIENIEVDFGVQLTANAEVIRNAYFNQSTGQVELNLLGGTKPYQVFDQHNILIQDNINTNNITLSDLSARASYFIIKDAVGNTLNVPYEIIKEDDYEADNFEITVYDDNLCDGASANIEFVYSFPESNGLSRWEIKQIGGDFQQSSTVSLQHTDITVPISNLSYGSYEISVISLYLIDRDLYELKLCKRGETEFSFEENNGFLIQKIDKKIFHIGNDWQPLPASGVTVDSKGGTRLTGSLATEDHFGAKETGRFSFYCNGHNDIEQGDILLYPFEADFSRSDLANYENEAIAAWSNVKKRIITLTQADDDKDGNSDFYACQKSGLHGMIHVSIEKKRDNIIYYVNGLVVDEVDISFVPQQSYFRIIGNGLKAQIWDPKTDFCNPCTALIKEQISTVDISEKACPGDVVEIQLPETIKDYRFKITDGTSSNGLACDYSNCLGPIFTVVTPQVTEGSTGFNRLDYNVQVFISDLDIVCGTFNIEVFQSPEEDCNEEVEEIVPLGFSFNNFGANVILSEDVQVWVNMDIVNNNEINTSTSKPGEFDGQGKIYLSEHWVNNAFDLAFDETSQVEVLLFGENDQEIRGPHESRFPSLVCEGTGVKSLKVNTQIKEVLSLNNNLHINDFNINVLSKSVESVETNGSAVITDGVGEFGRTISSSGVYLYPIATEAYGYLVRPLSVHANMDLEDKLIRSKVVGRNPLHDHNVAISSSTRSLNTKFYHNISYEGGVIGSFEIDLAYNKDEDGSFNSVLRKESNLPVRSEINGQVFEETSEFWRKLMNLGIGENLTSSEPINAFVRGTIRPNYSDNVFVLGQAGFYTDVKDFGDDVIITITRDGNDDPEDESENTDGTKNYTPEPLEGTYTLLIESGNECSTDDAKIKFDVNSSGDISNVLYSDDNISEPIELSYQLYGIDGVNGGIAVKPRPEGRDYSVKYRMDLSGDWVFQPGESFEVLNDINQLQVIEKIYVSSSTISEVVYSDIDFSYENMNLSAGSYHVRVELANQKVVEGFILVR